MSIKMELSELINRGNTPCINLLTECYPKDCDKVLGKIIAYSNMGLGKCVASRERISKELGMNPTTFDRKIKFLEAQGLIKDETPELRNHPHTYSVNTKRLEEEIDLYEEYKCDEVPTITNISSE